jgi:hypothetical protein
MKKTPMQMVNNRFGSRAALVDALMPLLESSDQELQGRLLGTSNKKLLRIHETAEIVQNKFGARKDLVEQVVTLRYPNGKPDDGFLKRVEESSLKRLLDMYRQAGGK